MSNYYYLASTLPPLKIGEPSPDINFDSLEEALRTNLTERDYAKVRVIRRLVDILNIRAFWKNEPFDPHGNLDSVELEDALIGGEGLPDYVYDFVDKYDSLGDRLAHFPELALAFCTVEEEHASGFLKKYIAFEREWRLVVLGFRAKQLGRDVTKELQFEDPDDDMVAQILAQKDAKNYIPPEGYQDLQVIFELYANQPLELYKALAEYRFNKIEKMLGLDMFSIDRILGYLAQLIMVEKWIALDKKKGIEVMNRVLGTTQK